MFSVHGKITIQENRMSISSWMRSFVLFVIDCVTSSEIEIVVPRQLDYWFRNSWPQMVRNSTCFECMCSSKCQKIGCSFNLRCYLSFCFLEVPWHYRSIKFLFLDNFTTPFDIAVNKSWGIPHVFSVWAHPNVRKSIVNLIPACYVSFCLPKTTWKNRKLISLHLDNLTTDFEIADHKS